MPSAPPRKWLTLIAMCLGLGMLMVDTFVVNVALPTIARDFEASLSAAEWVISAYVLLVAVFPVAMGRLGDIFGRRRVYLLGLALFVGSSLAAGLAPSIEVLIATRVVQGIGAAVMMPGTLSIITQAFPAAERGLAIGIWGGVSGLGLIAGPLLGGIIVSGTGDWRWVFLVNLPIGLVAAALTFAFVRESRDTTAPKRIDWAGLVTLSGGLFLLVFALNRGSADGWTSPRVLGLALLGALLLAAFVRIEGRVRAPLVDLTLFRSGTLVAACLAAFLFSAAVFGSQPYMSLFMQNYWGFSPLQGGLAFLPATALVALLMPVSGIVGQRLGSRLRLILMLASMCVLVSALLVMRITVESGYADGLLGPFLIRGLGIGLFMSASSFAVVSSVPAARSGLASGALTMSRNIGTAFGVALLGAVYLRGIDSRLPAALEGDPSAAVTLGAAEHFVLAGSETAQAVARVVVVQAFLDIALATVVLAGIATLASFFIRRLAHASDPEPAEPVVPQLAAREEPAPVR